MSMIGNLARISEETRIKLHESPELITALLYPSMPASTPKKAGFLDRFFGGQQTPVPFKTPGSPAFPPLSPDDVLDIDKAWHGLHFLFTGSDWEGDFPEGFLVAGGEPVGDVDVGYGPARSFSPDDVAAIAKFLESQSQATLKARLDGDKMEELEIYPFANSDNIDLDEEWEYLAENLKPMKTFIAATAAKKMALLVYLN